MARITKEVTRQIIEDFAEEIMDRRSQTAKPTKEVINFRDDMLGGFEREVWQVPIDLLRYRKDNGRIASDVLDYERNIGPLDEKDDHAQGILRDFLEKKDPERTGVLRKAIAHTGQQQPAIITCDGFLINGNRRKMVMDGLRKENPNDQRYQYMKVVILPGQGDIGGPPTLLEIEKIENRYQLQSDGKSEYYGFDRALSIKRKMDLGFTIEEQLADDPAHVGATSKELKKAVDRCKRDYLDPLECVDRYLQQFRREGLYRTVSKGVADPDGRWQAFLDYSNTFNSYFKSPKRRIEIGIEDDEIGDLEEAAFDIIRLRAVPDMPKVHSIMRNLHKYCRTDEGKRAIKLIAEKVAPVLPPEELIDPDGKELPIESIDAKWAAKNIETITYNVKKASLSHESLKERETPIDLLQDACKKLNHKNMDLTAIDINDLDTARKIVVSIISRAQSLESDIYHFKKMLKKLTRKKS
ncbi:MAG: hypothetical protein J4F39_14165 [Candidatus Latescibacteria bacterium]|nr:hypothetical protein [Candidatus Latescibacterota bacterium]